jgi:hypothetical protein
MGEKTGARRWARIMGACAVALLVSLTPAVGSARSTGQQQQSPASGQPPAVSTDPVATLTELLATACRQDKTKFPEFLTAANAELYRKLAPNQQVALLRRLVLMQDAGRPLLSTDSAGRTVLRCESSAFTAEIHLGVPRTEPNLAFVPVEIKPDRRIEFGMVQSNGGWRLISIGVLMLDLSQLAPEWEAQEMADREAGIIAALRKIGSAIDTYRNAFEKLPETLAQLGPAPKEGISPEAAGLLDAGLIADHISGYAIRYVVLPTGPDGKNTQFELLATPDEYDKSGRRSFFINSTGKLRGGDKKGAPANAADPVIEDSSSSN